MPRWFPCQHPERPLDDEAAYHWDCRGCAIAVAAGAATATDPDKRRTRRVILRIITPSDREVDEWIRC